jgi:hypothetical protein
MRSSLALSLLIALSSSALADRVETKSPVRSGAPAMVAAERAWQVAERERDPKRAAVAWQLAAIAFDRAASVSRGEQGTDAAYSAVLAWKNAMVEQPGMPPARIDNALDDIEQGLVQAIGRYLGRAPTSDEVANLMLLRASVLRRHGMFDEAMVDWIDIVTNHPASEVAEFAANLLLDTLNRRGEFDKLAEWVEKFHADAKLLANRPDLTDVVRTLHVQVIRKRAERLEADGRSGKPDAYAQAAQLYLDLFKSHPDKLGDELLFNAAVCHELAGAIGAARKTFGDVIKRFPKSSRAATARERMKKLPP